MFRSCRFVLLEFFDFETRFVDFEALDRECFHFDLFPFEFPKFHLVPDIQMKREVGECFPDFILLLEMDQYGSEEEDQPF